MQKYRPTLQEIEEAMETYSGFCRACGDQRGECEPDARKYKCEECGAHEVYGAEEYVIRDWVKEDAVC